MADPDVLPGAPTELRVSGEMGSSTVWNQALRLILPIHQRQQKRPFMRSIVYIVGLVVIVLAVLSFFGLR